MVNLTPEQLFDSFVAAKNQEDVFEFFHGIKEHVSKVCGTEGSSTSITFYHRLKQTIKSWRAQSIWKILDERVNHPVYNKNVVCEGKRMLVIGAGPIGLRMAIECAFLGGDSHVIEKRSSATRNNILHLWPFTIDDLRRLGAKKFYGQFCAGAIDHISIRQLQLILLKICCILGVQFHIGVEFRGVEEPTVDRNGKCAGWGIHAVPHPPSLPKWGWEAMIQASGRQHVLPVFQYKEFRGQQAIGMTVNFVNRGTMEELTIEEISGIAFIYNQEFFNEMYAELGISLENIVYYKDETHYFVMSTKKHSLLDKKVLKKDYPNTSELLSPDNIDYTRAQTFAREVAGFATNLPVLEFMKNHHGKADVAIFDFSAIKQAANSTVVLERKGQKLVMCLVGDSLLEPFWPQGTGCARGFLSVANSAWMFKKYFSGVSIYEVLRERESLFKLLAQSSPMKLNSKHDKYTIDPSTRYNYWTVSAEQFEVFHLYNREDTPIVNNYQGSTVAVNTRTPADVRSKRRTREDRRKTIQVTVNRSYSKESDDKEASSPTTPTLEHGSLLNWARESTCGYRGVRVTNLTTSWKSGLAFSALIHRYRPDILNFTAVSTKPAEQILKTVFDTTSREFGIRSVLSAQELAGSSIPDRQKIVQYLTALHSHFNSEASKSLQISPDMCYFCSRHITPEQLTSSHGVKFHSSCLKCEHCLDKISLNTLHYVDEKMAKEFAQRRRPGYPDCKSGFYCKFHFKEYFTGKSESLYPKNWLDNLETDLISSSTDPLSTSTTPDLPHSDNEDSAAPRDHSHELRRAKSSASVKNLRDMFESISTGTSQPDLTPANKQEEEEKKEVKLPNGHLKYAVKSKSFSGALPIKKDDQDQIKDFDNEIVSPTITAKPKKGKKKKSGIAKKIERKMGSVRASKSSLSKIDSDSVLVGPGVDQSLANDSFASNQRKKSRFKIFKKKKPGSGSTSPSPVLTSASESNLDETASLIITNKSDSLPNSKNSIFKKPESKKDPLYTIANPEYKAESQDDSLSDATSSSSFIRNSLARRTAPPKMHTSLLESSPEDLVDSNACRRVPSKVIQNLSREAVVLQTNSPEARSLLRNSFRNSKRGMNAGSIKQNLNFNEDSVSLPGTPKSSRVQITRASSQQALINPSTDGPPSEAHLISKAYYSPKPKRAQKVKLDNVEVVDTSATTQLAAEGTVVHRKSCSPLPQRSKKVRLSMSRKSPLNMSLEFSSEEEETPPKRPELPKNLDLILGIKPKHLVQDQAMKDTMETDSAPTPPVRGISSDSPVSAPLTSPVVPSQPEDQFDKLASSLKSDGSESNSKSQLLSNSLTISESSVSSSAEVFETKSGSNYYRNFMYAKRVPADPLDQKRLSLGQVSETSEYYTPGTHRSTLTSPSEEIFHTPDQSFDQIRSAATTTVPAKRSSEPVENGTSKRSSVGLEEIADQVLENIEQTLKITSSKISSRTSDVQKTPSKSAQAEKPVGRRSEPVLSNRANRVLNENMSPKDHSSINKILEKYRRIPSSPSPDISKSRPVESIRDKPKRSISERQARLTANAAKRSATSNPQQRVKMIHQLSNSFDKTIDRLVNKYYPKKDGSRTSTPAHDSSKGSNNSSRDSTNRNRDTPTKDRKSSSSSTKDIQRSTSSDSPRRSNNYDNIKRHPSTPSRYYSYKSSGDSSRKCSTSDDKTDDVLPNGTPTKTSGLPSNNRTRESSETSSTISRESSKRSSQTSGRTDKVDTTENRKSEPAPPKTPTRSSSRASVARETSLNSPGTNTPVKGTPKPRSAPLRSSTSQISLRSFNADKFRYNDSRGRRSQSQTAESCDCRTATHAPTCKKWNRADDKDSHENTDTTGKEDLENIAYIELSDTERLKHWDKTDYSKYLKSLRYQGSGITRSSSFNVKDTVKAFQRKETDV